MKKLAIAALLLLAGLTLQAADNKPWKHGRLTMSANHRFLQHTDGTPFFWLGDTGWLLPQRLNRDEVALYLQNCAELEFNVVQVQVLNDYPAYNTYGHSSDDEAYWRHMDYIVEQAEQRGIYIGMVCIWGSQVKRGALSVETARKYGEFLANRYKQRPNIVWIIGGDLRGDIKPEIWETLATSIRTIDPQHLMTFHPRGRFTSAWWWAGRDWIDLHMFQSGHRRYGQQMGSKDYIIPAGTEEDNWRFVQLTWGKDPDRPVIDGEPAYEDIPQGLHDPAQPRWQPADVRRYAYWSVFAGSCGHTYGHNSIMQFYRPGIPPAYGAETPWYDVLQAEGRTQMRHLKHLMLRFPYFERVPDSLIVADNGERYDRLMATRGNDYLLVYNYTGRQMTLDLTRISGVEEQVWWMNAADGTMQYIGRFPNRRLTFRPHNTADGVLIAFDAAKEYVK